MSPTATPTAPTTPTASATSYDGLQLAPPAAPGASRGAGDGTWRPGTRDLAAELPPLLAEMTRLGTPVTRVSYVLSEWDEAARRLHTGGRQVRLGDFTAMAANTVRLTSSHDVAVVLDVVPSTTAVTPR